MEKFFPWSWSFILSGGQYCAEGPGKANDIRIPPCLLPPIDSRIPPKIYSQDLYSSGGLVSTPDILITKQKSRDYLCLTGA